MITARQKKIVDIINEKKAVTNKELLGMLFISEATLRRDLTALANQGLIIRTHGGATIKDSKNIESSILIRSQKNINEKKKIAQRCLDFINEGDAIFIDSSSTVGYMLPLLTQFRNLTFITNGINNALILSNHHNNFSIHITPGVFNPHTNSLLGGETANHIKNFHCNVSIFSCSGISKYGITEPSRDQSIIKKEMLAHSKLNILLVDHTKFDKIYMSQTCEFSDLDIIITDKEPSSEYVDLIKQNNCRLIIAR